jgi:hypothetical protein
VKQEGMVMKAVGYDKWLDIKVCWNGMEKFDVLYQRMPDEWIVIDTFTKQGIKEPDQAKWVAADYIEMVEKEMVAA